MQQVIRLEGLVNTTTAKDSDRIAAGAFLVMIYGRLRFSDMQRSSGFAIDSVVHEGVEVGYLEGRAERTKTSISLERKVRALPVAVPLKCVGPRPWVRTWINLRVSQGLDDSFPVLPNPAALVAPSLAPTRSRSLAPTRLAVTCAHVLGHLCPHAPHNG